MTEIINLYHSNKISLKEAVSRLREIGKNIAADYLLLTNE